MLLNNPAKAGLECAIFPATYLVAYSKDVVQHVPSIEAMHELRAELSAQPELFLLF